MNRELIGSLTAIYTAAQLLANECPSLGMRYRDANGDKEYIFLQNSGASAITAQLFANALGADKTNHKCALAAATDALMGFAGVRAVAADSMAQNECGWFQYKGYATLIAGATGVTIDDQVVSSADAAGKVETMAATVASLKASIGEAIATASSADCLVFLSRSVWG